jgi:trk system potassium uptake protein TrkH
VATSVPRRLRSARLRRAVRGETIGVDVAGALNLVGVLVKWFSLSFLFPAVIALGYGESPWPFLVGAAAAAAFGLGVERATRGKERVGAREGFLVVSLLWLIVAALAAIPYLLSGEEQLTNFTDAYFESISGFTTTGSSVLSDIEALNHSFLMYRQFTQWIGGMGIIVLALAVLPRLRVGGRQLFEVEAPAAEFEPFTVTIREAARRFLVIYLGITVLESAILAVLGWTGVDEEMTLFEAVGHAFTSVSTGGFSTKNVSLAAFAAPTQWVVTGFLVVSATNFALLYRATIGRRLRVFLRDDEFRTYALLLVLACAVVFSEVVRAGLATGEAALRQSVFNSVSLLTTTGYANADYNDWTGLALIVLIGVMLIGASAGSTSGSIKVARHVIIGKMLRRELDQTIHPELVAPLRLNQRPLEERALRSVIMFTLLYLGILALGAFGVLIDSARADVTVNPFEAIAAAATTLGGVGPGLGFAGPVGNFDPFTDFSKSILIVLMWMGRLEIIPIVVLFTRSYWRA